MKYLLLGYTAAQEWDESDVSAEEIARVCVFMASDDSSYFVGQCLYPDGGRMIQAFPKRFEK